MPQMGESIAEGTIVRWIKKIGDAVDRDEPLFEISTDKVDAEIPSPTAGTLLEIKVKEGETVAVNSVVATIGTAGEAAATPPAKTATTATAPPPSGKAQPHTPQADGVPSPTSASVAPVVPPAPVAFASARGVTDASYGETSPQRPEGREGGPDRQKSSPLVRRIAKEHGVDIGQISGTGIAGRVTKNDILGYLSRSPASVPPAPQPGYGEARSPEVSAAGDRVEPMSIMRKKIAEHMVVSRRTSAHVYSVFEVNYTKVDEIRKARKADYEQRGVKLTYTSFIAKVAIDVLRRHPVINASIEGDNIVYKRDINLGVAVALDHGLIVPVVKRADELNLLGLTRAISDVADRARAKKLSPDEVHGGTFTITNPGNFGAQFGLPIINQPQVAILGVGTIEKRPVVIDDMIGIRLMGYLTLGYDHRLIDGAVADRFMAEVKNGIENFDPSQV
jgi:pyruvate dehydrogenase E2 component (dihydrolipoyllysine-residue acetyltransferase)